MVTKENLRILHTEEARGLFNYDKDHSRNYPDGYTSWQDYQEKIAAEYAGEFGGLSLFGREYKYYKRTCATCGEVFYCKSPRGRYCSGRCANDAYLARRRQHKAMRREKVCPMCHQSFKAKRADGKFCSAKCRQSHYRQRLVTGKCLPDFSKTQTRNSVTDKSCANMSATHKSNGVAMV